MHFSGSQPVVVRLAAPSTIMKAQMSEIARYTSHRAPSFAQTRPPGSLCEGAVGGSARALERVEGYMCARSYLMGDRLYVDMTKIWSLFRHAIEQESRRMLVRDHKPHGKCLLLRRG